MALQFRIHADKENAVHSSTGSAKILPGAVPPAIRGKTFVDAKTPAAATPRKALGVINRKDASSATRPQPLKPQAFQAGSSQAEKKKLFTPLRPDAKKLGESKKVKSKQPLSIQHEKLPEKTVKHLPKSQEKTTCASISAVCTEGDNDLGDTEIDTVQPVSTQKDTYEDILPVEEQSSTFLAKLFRWPPPCLFGVQPDSDSDDDGEDGQRQEKLIQQLDMLPKPVSTYAEPEEVIDLDSLLNENIEEEIPLPYIDEESFSLNDSACLNDSVPSPKLGSLQLKDM